MAQTCGRSETGALAHEIGALSINEEKARPPVPAFVFRTYFSLASVALGICVIATQAAAHEPLPDWSECPVADSPDARFAPLPIFVQTTVGSPVTSWPPVGAYDFCAYMDTVYCQMKTVFDIGIEPEIEQLATLTRCIDGDINGTTDPMAEPPLTPNGIPDGQYEMGILAAVLNDPTHPLHADAHAAVQANFVYFKDMIQAGLYEEGFLGIVPILCPYLIGSFSMMLAGYATLGDPLTYDAVDALLVFFEFFGSAPPPGGSAAVSESVPETGPEADIDGDSLTNRGEYDIVVTLFGYSATEYVAVALDPEQPGLFVTPAEDFHTWGYEGGPFAPASAVYTINNPYDMTINWTADTTENWLTASPDSGALLPSESVEVTVSLNANATALTPGDYTDAVVIVPDAYGTSVRNVYLTVLPIPGEIAVTDSIPPEDDHNLPFGDTVITLSYTEQATIANIDATYDLVIDEVALDSVLYGSGASGFALENLPPLPLTLAPGNNVTFDVAFEPLGEGLHEDVIVIRSNDMFAPELTVALSAVAAYDPLRVAPESGFMPQGHEGGPFIPAEKMYSLTNEGATPLQWSATAPAWLTLTPDGGALDAGLSEEVTVSVNATANGYAPGHHAGTLSFINDDTGLMTTLDVALVVVSATGNATVTDSIAPFDDRLLPFGDVYVGAERREIIAVHNISEEYDLSVESIMLDSVLYEEDFDDGTAEGWVPLDDSHWSVDSGRYRAAAPAYTGFMQAWYMEEEFGDAVFEATVQLNTGNGFAALIVRASDDFVFYGPGAAVGVWLTRTNDYIVFLQNEWEPSFALFTSPHLFTDGTPNHVRIKMLGRTFYVYFNGNLARTFSYQHALESGRVVLGGHTTATNPTVCHFDDIKVCLETQFRLEGVPALPLALAPGEFLAFDAVFAPLIRGEHQDVARVVTDNLYEPEVEVMLTGTGLGNKRYVRINGDDINDGLSWATAKATLQAALEMSDAGDDIWVAAGTYYPTSKNDLVYETSERAKHFRLKDGVYLYGGFNGTETMLEQRDWEANATRLSGDIGDPGNIADNCHHVIYNHLYVYNEYPMRLDGFIISDGNANETTLCDYGGGMCGRFIQLTIANCVFENNASDRGGGAYLYGNDVLLVDCKFIGNRIPAGDGYNAQGGGLYFSGYYLTLLNCDFTQNFISYEMSGKGWGGGARITGTNILISGCMFDSNYISMMNSSSGGYGGGADISGRNVVVENCMFSNNSVNAGGSTPFSEMAAGGGLVFSCWPGYVNNSRFISNNATVTSGTWGGGGAVFGYDSWNTTIMNCIFFDNHTNGRFGGGAMFNSNTDSMEPTVTSIMNNTAFGNTATSGTGGAFLGVSWNDNAQLIAENNIFRGNNPDEIYVGSNPAVIAYSNIQGGFAGEGNIDVEPLFVNAVAGDFRLQIGSPCINAGDPAGVPPAPETDILGTLRPQDGRVDMGAYEHDDTPPAVEITLLSPAQTGADSILFAVTFSEPVKPALAADDLVVTGTLSGYITVAGGGTDYVVTVTLSDPDADGTVGLELPAGAVADPAGNLCAGGASPLVQVFNWRGILVEPSDARLYHGDFHILQVQPDCGADNIQYQWKWDDGNKAVYDGPQTPEWPLGEATLAMRGVYWCEMTYDGVLYATTPASIEVEPPLEIINGPEGGVRAVGGSHTFSVEVVGGYEPLSYGWQKDDIEIADAPDAPVYVINALTADHEGVYSVVISDANTALIVSDGAPLIVSEDGMPVGAAAAAVLALLLAGAYAMRRRKRG